MLAFPTLGYEGFPKVAAPLSMRLSVTGIPNEFDILEEGISINGLYYHSDGYYADASRMFTIGKTTPQKRKLVRVAKECLEIGVEAAETIWFCMGDIGHTH